MSIELNSKDFVEDIKRFLNRSSLKISELRREVATDALRSLVQYTPWDTGRARGNWRVNYGDPAIGYDPSRRDPTGDEAISEGTQRINARVWRRWDGAFTADLYITNNTSYIDTLNDGRPSRGEFQAHNRSLGFMTARTDTYLQTKYLGRG